MELIESCSFSEPINNYNNKIKSYIIGDRFDLLKNLRLTLIKEKNLNNFLNIMDIYLKNHIIYQSIRYIIQ